MAALTTTLAISAGLTALSTGYGMHQSQQAKKTAKGQASAEQARIAEADKVALGERKELIDKQRRQIGAGNKYNTNPTGATGIQEGLLG